MQVIKYVPYKPASPFEQEEGGFVADNPNSMFAEPNEVDEVEVTPVAKKVVSSDAELDADPFADSPPPKKAVKEPVKRTKKVVEPTPAEDEEVSEILDIWGSEED